MEVEVETCSLDRRPGLRLLFLRGQGLENFLSDLPRGKFSLRERAPRGGYSRAPSKIRNKNFHSTISFPLDDRPANWRLFTANVP